MATPWLKEGYDLLERLGDGSFGRVELIKKRSDGSLLALKVVDKPAGVDSAEVEIAALKAVNSPFIVRCLWEMRGGSGKDKWISFAIDAAMGGTLRQRLSECRDKGDRMSLEEILHIFTQILLGVQVIHNAKIVHRDLNPANIMFVEADPSKSATGYGRVQIIDFGVSGSVASSPLSNTAGTPSYMAPEVAKAAPHSYPADIYSLGVIFYELLEMKLPQRDDKGGVTLTSYPALTGFLNALLSPDPNKRPTIDKLLRVPKIAPVAKEYEGAQRIVANSADWRPRVFEFKDLGMTELQVFEEDVEAIDARIYELEAAAERMRQAGEDRRAAESIAKAESLKRQRELIIQKQQARAKEKKEWTDQVAREKEARKKEAMKHAEKVQAMLAEKRKTVSQADPEGVIRLEGDEKSADELEGKRRALENRQGPDKIIEAFWRLRGNPKLTPPSLGVPQNCFQMIQELATKDAKLFA